MYFTSPSYLHALLSDYSFVSLVAPLSLTLQSKVASSCSLSYNNHLFVLQARGNNKFKCAFCATLAPQCFTRVSQGKTPLIFKHE